jgi:hypothetical protein
MISLIYYKNFCKCHPTQKKIFFKNHSLLKKKEEEEEEGKCRLAACGSHL